MSRFKIGDRVVAVKENICVPVGTRGTVTEKDTAPFVEWDNDYGRYSLQEMKMELDTHVTPHKRKYTPGQPLTSAAEVMQALLDGEKIGLVFGGFFHLQDRGELWTNEGKRIAPDLTNPKSPWTIYTPPKRKVKSERWFAVSTPWSNPNDLCWSGQFSTEAEARKTFPNASGYVRAAIEVEVEA